MKCFAIDVILSKEANVPPCFKRYDILINMLHFEIQGQLIVHDVKREFFFNFILILYCDYILLKIREVILRLWNVRNTCTNYSFNVTYISNPICGCAIRIYGTAELCTNTLIHYTGSVKCVMSPNLVFIINANVMSCSHLISASFR